VNKSKIFGVKEICPFSPHYPLQMSYNGIKEPKRSRGRLGHEGRQRWEGKLKVGMVGKGEN
jgi:hypothetical protein